MEDCLYKIGSRKQYQDIINTINYCSHCVKVRKYLDEDDGSNNDELERQFNAENNDDCLSAFQTTRDYDDVASAIKIVISMAGNTVFNTLLDNPVIQSIDKITCGIAFQKTSSLRCNSSISIKVGCSPFRYSYDII